VRELLAHDPRIGLSVSATTRPPREGEVDGREYRFLSRPEFEALRDAGGFLEWFEVYDHLYGTPGEEVAAHLAAGRDVALEIDVQGAMAVREAFPEALLVFVRPPSRSEQRRRLRERGTDAATLTRRLARAEGEEALADHFDAVVVNDQLDRAVGEVAAILEARREADER
jgi:guanylate kinase